MTVVPIVWPYALRSIERLVEVFEGLDATGRLWTPDAPGANSVAVMVSHTISNAEENLLQAVCGYEVAYDRQADFDVPQTDVEAVRARWERLRGRFDGETDRLDDTYMLESVAHPRRGSMTRLDALVVVTRHAAEHLAQAELTRDLYHHASGGQR